MLNQQGQQKLENMLNDTHYIYFHCGNIKIIHCLYSYSFANWGINKDTNIKTFLKLVRLTGVTILFADKLS